MVYHAFYSTVFQEFIAGKARRLKEKDERGEQSIRATRARERERESREKSSCGMKRRWSELSVCVREEVEDGVRRGKSCERHPAAV